HVTGVQTCALPIYCHRSLFQVDVHDCSLSLWYHGWNGCHRPRKSSASWLLVAFPEPATWLSCRTPLNPCSAVASTATEREALADAPGSMEVCSPADAETNDRPSSPVSRMPCEASAAVKIGRAHV